MELGDRLRFVRRRHSWRARRVRLERGCTGQDPVLFYGNAGRATALPGPQLAGGMAVPRAAQRSEPGESAGGRRARSGSCAHPLIGSRPGKQLGLGAGDLPRWSRRPTASCYFNDETIPPRRARRRADHGRHEGNAATLSWRRHGRSDHLDSAGRPTAPRHPGPGRNTGADPPPPARGNSAIVAAPAGADITARQRRRPRDRAHQLSPVHPLLRATCTPVPGSRVRRPGHSTTTSTSARSRRAPATSAPISSAPSPTRPHAAADPRTSATSACTSSASRPWATSCPAASGSRRKTWSVPSPCASATSVVAATRRLPIA